MGRIFFSTWILVCALSFTGRAQQQTVHITEGNPVTLTATSKGAISFLWLLNNEPINGWHDNTITASKPGTYTVIGLGHSCDSDPSDPVYVILDQAVTDQEDPVTVVDLQLRNEANRPVVVINGTFTHQLLIVNNGTNTATRVQVNTTFAPNVQYTGILGSYTGRIDYLAATRELLWRPGDMAPGQAESLTIGLRAEREGQASQSATVTSSETDSRPSDNQATGSVEVIALKIPNTFTPNGDGLNDYFEIRGLESFSEYRLTVFNRWGNEVYRSDRYRNDWNGGGLGEGTYYYALEIRLHSGRSEVFKGFVTIVRNTHR